MPICFLHNKLTSLSRNNCSYYTIDSTDTGITEQNQMAAHLYTKGFNREFEVSNLQPKKLWLENGVGIEGARTYPQKKHDLTDLILSDSYLYEEPTKAGLFEGELSWVSGRPRPRSVHLGPLRLLLLLQRLQLPLSLHAPFKMWRVFQN